MLPPAQTGDNNEAVIAGNPLTATVAVALAEQPPPSVTVTVYTPEAGGVADKPAGSSTWAVKPFGPNQEKL